MSRLEDEQRRFYLEKYAKYGDDPRSVSWNDRTTQNLRFRKLTELFKYEDSQDYSVHEVGCGLAHFKEYLDGRGFKCVYSGSDIVEEFIGKAGGKYPDCDFYLQSINVEYGRIAEEVKGRDYYCLSGTFNPREDTPAEEWESFIYRSVGNMFRMAGKGVGFNFLTSYSDFYNERLYYADPGKVMDWCVKNLSRFVSISHDIPLYEFTVNVYKEKFFRERFPDYKRYFKGV